MVQIAEKSRTFALGKIMGLGIGTVIAAFTMGKGVAIVGNLIDKKFIFVSELSKKEEAQQE